MMSETDKFIPPGDLLHDALNHVSSIISIAQFCLISKEASPEVQRDLKRIIETTREVATNLKRLAETLEEKED